MIKQVPLSIDIQTKGYGPGWAKAEGNFEIENIKDYLISYDFIGELVFIEGILDRTEVEISKLENIKVTNDLSQEVELSPTQLNNLTEIIYERINLIV